MLLCCVVLVWPVSGWADPEHIIAEVEALVLAEQAAGVDYVRLGDAYLAGGDLGKAQKAYEKAVSLGKVALGHTGIGKVFAQTPGRGLKAQYHFRRALGKDPHFAEAQYHLARLYTRMRPLEAEEAFSKALDMDPDHGDAHFQLGQLMEGAGDRAGALVAYERQILVNEAHGDARYRLGKLLFAQGNQAKAARIFAGLIRAGGEVGTKAYLEMALMSQMARNFDASEKLFERYIDRLPDNEKETFFDIALVATKEEWAIFESTSDSLKPGVVRRFWASRDPAPLSRANERLIEHYRRVAYALRSFSKGQFPWDDRGEVYVRLGDPDHVSRFDDIQIELDPHISEAREQFATRIGPGFLPPGGRPLFPIDGRWEYWVYADIDGGTEF
ncbi:MAG: GWxTD domain-containing protein, partial [Candidatus Latescibacteria bacterium]|nr:GWxTD domain-containing protein [Candidatus Latescibacterota bacterium]